jgi:hypothetical protein
LRHGCQRSEQKIEDEGRKEGVRRTTDDQRPGFVTVEKEKVEMF